jgi:hypothetical protein
MFRLAFHSYILVDLIRVDDACKLLVQFGYDMAELRKEDYIIQFARIVFEVEQLRGILRVIHILVPVLANHEHAAGQAVSVIFA